MLERRLPRVETLLREAEDAGDRLNPAAQQAGEGIPRLTFFPVHNLIRLTATRPTSFAGVLMAAVAEWRPAAA